MEQNHPRPSNYLALSIIGILLCCIPGIVSVIYAARVNGLYAEGKYAQANAASSNAKTWGIVALVLGVISWIINIFFGIAAAASEFAF